MLPTVHVPRYRKRDRRFRRTVGEVRSSVRFAIETLDADAETKKRLTTQDWTGMTLAQEPTAIPKIRKPYFGLAIAGFTVGLAGLLLGLIPILFILAWVLGAAALVFSIVGRRHGLGNAGIAVSIAAIVMGFVGVAIVASATSKLERDLNSISSDLSSAASAAPTEAPTP